MAPIDSKSNSTGIPADVRCDCGRLLARRMADHYEVKCPRCKEHLELVCPCHSNLARQQD